MCKCLSVLSAAILIVYANSSCTKSNFKGQTVSQEAEVPTAEVSEQNPVASTSSISNSIDSENISETVIDAGFKGGFESKSLAPDTKNHIWLATANGIAQHLILENGVVKSKKSWANMTPAGGTRTYVLEGGGAIMSKNGGFLYFLHDGVPEGAVNLDPAQGAYFQLPGLAAGDRTCLVSYRKNGKRTIGMAYGAGYFVEVEQDDKPPFGPKFATLTSPVNAGPLSWGYSCYIDQVRLQFFSQFYQGATQGLDLKTMLPLDLSKAPNFNFASTNLPGLTLGAKNLGTGSYAMSGDRVGNVFNGIGFYTMAFEAKNAMVWGSNGTNMTILPQDCLSKSAECKGFATYNLMESIGAGIGPLSALSDGSMVGIVRGVGDVFLFKLKVANDATQGINAVKIVDKVGGDPYMYTDFTGATLYLNNSLSEMDFTRSPQFEPKLPIRQLAFSWSQVDGNTDSWKDIKAEFRCYTNSDDKGVFQEIAVSATAKANQYIEVTSCKDKLATKAEVQLTQLNNSSSLMGVAKVQLTAIQ